MHHSSIIYPVILFDDKENTGDLNTCSLTCNSGFYLRLLALSLWSALAAFQHDALSNLRPPCQPIMKSLLKTRNRLHPWLHNDLTNGWEAGVSVAWRTWHGWLSSSALWSFHGIPGRKQRGDGSEDQQILTNFSSKACMFKLQFTRSKQILAPSISLNPFCQENPPTELQFSKKSITSSMCRGSAERELILTPVLSVISRWAHQYAAAATPIPNKQPEKADRSIDAVLSGDLIFQDSLMARKRSNGIFWYQIGLLSWLIRVWGRRCVKVWSVSRLVPVFIYFFLMEGRLRVNYAFGNSRIHWIRQRSKSLLRYLHLINNKLRPN